MNNVIVMLIVAEGMGLQGECLEYKSVAFDGEFPILPPNRMIESIGDSLYKYCMLQQRQVRFCRQNHRETSADSTLSWVVH